MLNPLNYLSNRFFLRTILYFTVAFRVQSAVNILLFEIKQPEIVIF